MKQLLKTLVERLPDKVNLLLNHIPYRIRIGKGYTKHKESIKQFDKLSTSEKQYYIFNKFLNIVTYAYTTIPFYQKTYTKHNFHPAHLKQFEDIQRIPIVKKSDFLSCDLEDRSHNVTGRILTNTGGTSGRTLAFFCEPNPYAREWAHMHHIWENLDYDFTKNKLTFRGVNIGKSPLQYSLVKNEYLVNAYIDYSLTAEAIHKLLKKKDISYLHGYPSFIYDFTRFCTENNQGLITCLKNKLKGIFLSSEFPAPVYRDLIEKVWGVPTLSWYGHSERVILAYEKNQPYLYEPMHTYGFCEAVPGENKESNLVGTCFANIASPFIRYDTGDSIQVIKQEDGLLTSFQIAQGRKGEYIVDNKGHRISLTALIFGRHHKIFDIATFIQIQQNHHGDATILLTIPGGNNLDTITDLFDSSNVDMTFNFKILDAPIRSKNGKVPLLVK